MLKRSAVPSQNLPKTSVEILIKKQHERFKEKFNESNRHERIIKRNLNKEQQSTDIVAKYSPDNKIVSEEIEMASETRNDYSNYKIVPEETEMTHNNNYNYENVSEETEIISESCNNYLDYEDNIIFDQDIEVAFEINVASQNASVNSFDEDIICETTAEAERIIGMNNIDQKMDEKTTLRRVLKRVKHFSVILL